MAKATRQRLIDGALESVRRHGIAGTSARSIAAAAEVNQALIFYHFGSVSALLVEACRHEAELRIQHYRDRLAPSRRSGIFSIWAGRCTPRNASSAT